ncbi:MAG TPA: MarC family NAAT transporter [Pseudolabrys sp.]|nr:MarC family NAAT transporter [Pseudolabrys sp.]
MDIFLLVLAALFPVVNPPGSALVFLSLTKRATAEARRSLAQRVAINAFFVMAGSLLAGAFILKLYGISVPVLRVAGGLIVAVSGWRLLNEGSIKSIDETPEQGRRVDYANQAFYPLTLPLTTGPGTIAVMISLGLSRSAYSDHTQDFRFLLAGLFATIAMAVMVYACFAYSHWIERVLGRGGTDIAVRLSAFILFCLGVQIIWTGASDLLRVVIAH